MVKELESVVLTVDLPKHRLKKGDVGTVVLEHGGAGYEVEFMTLSGETVAVVSLSDDQVRPVGRHDIARARAMTRAARTKRLIPTGRRTRSGMASVIRRQHRPGNRVTV